MTCNLIDRKTKDPIEQEATRTDWVRGEYDVTGSIPQITDANWSLARQDAIDRAREQLLEKYACEGGCDLSRDFCVLDVSVAENRCGRIERRVVENPPDSFQAQRLGQKTSEHVFLTYEVRAEALCRCASPPRSPARPGGDLQSASPEGSLLWVPPAFTFGHALPGIGAIVGGAVGSLLACGTAGGAGQEKVGGTDGKTEGPRD